MLKAIREIRTKIGAEIQHMHNIESCAEHSWGGRAGVLNPPMAPSRPHENAPESRAEHSLGGPRAGRGAESSNSPFLARLKRYQNPVLNILRRAGVLNRQITAPRPRKNASESRAEHSWGGRGGVLNYSAESSNYPTLPA